MGSARARSSLFGSERGTNAAVEALLERKARSSQRYPVIICQFSRVPGPEDVNATPHSHRTSRSDVDIPLRLVDR